MCICSTSCPFRWTMWTFQSFRWRLILWHIADICFYSTDAMLVKSVLLEAGYDIWVVWIQHGPDGELILKKRWPQNKLPWFYFNLLPVPGQEVPSASAAAHAVLLWSLFIHLCRVWIGHQLGQKQTAQPNLHNNCSISRFLQNYRWTFLYFFTFV